MAKTACKVVRSAFRVLGVGFGSLLLLRIALHAFGGMEHLFEFSAETPHKLTALSMLHGSLRLHPGILGSEHDEQVYNGATFTNFGFGVPLVQLPFHWLTRRMHKGDFFPDRLIFFVVLSALVPTLWTAIHRYVSPYDRGLRAWAFSWSLTLATVAYSLFVLLSFRFIQYEEAISYLVVFELFALAFYLRFAVSWQIAWVGAAGAAAGLATLVRPSGAEFLALLGALLVWRWRRLRVALVYAVGAGPFLAFWFYTNWLKGGSPLSLGYQNSNAWGTYIYPTIRFGTQCNATPSLALTTAWTLFVGFFVHSGNAPPELGPCHFVFEARSPGQDLPFFPPWVLLLVLGSILVYLARVPRRLDFFFPHAAFVALFLTFAHAGVGFGYRYIGDFWPTLAVIGIMLVRHVRIGEQRLARDVVTLASALYVAVLVVQDVAPYLPSVATMDAANLLAIEADWERIASTEQPPVPRRFTCGDRLAGWMIENGLGLGPRCEFSGFANLYLGVPERKDTHYTLRLHLDRPILPIELRVFVNGANYKAHLEGDVLVAPVSIHYPRLYTPVVLVALWTLEPNVNARLDWIELA